MIQSQTGQQFAVLFVDDEEKALKYFRMAYADEFRIITAANVAEALRILEAQAKEIGVLITDQRMPGDQGVDLLRRARVGWPRIVRILTTAYSDLESAIEAVNSGEILRYVTKPWNIQGLRAELRQAMDYFLLRRERDLLMEEKFSVRQRLQQSDRLRDLLVIASGLRRLRHAHRAVAAYVQDGLHGTAADPQAAASLELWGLTVGETRSLMAINRSLQALDRRVGEGFPQQRAVDGLLRAAGFEVTGGCPPQPMDGALLEATIAILGRMSGTPVRAEVRENGSAEGGAGLTAVLHGTRSLADVFRRVGEENDGLLEAYLGVWHHGGRLRTEAVDEAVSFRFTLPREPGDAQPSEPDEGWLEAQFALLESWD